MTRILIPRSDSISAKKINPSDFEKYFECHLPEHIICGLALSAQCPNILAVNISSGNARFKGYHLNNSATCSVVSLTASNTNKIYMNICRDVSCEADEYTFASTTGAVPACGFHIGNAITGSSTVTSTTINAVKVPSTNIEHAYSGLSSFRTALTYWNKKQPFFDTCDNIWYHNSHACAPTSITWTEIGSTFLITRQEDKLTSSECTTSTSYVSTGLSITLANRAGGTASITAMMPVCHSTTPVNFSAVLYDDGSTLNGDARHADISDNDLSSISLIKIMDLNGSVINVRMKIGTGGGGVGNMYGIAGTGQAMMNVLELGG